MQKVLSTPKPLLSSSQCFLGNSFPCSRLAKRRVPGIFYYGLLLCPSQDSAHLLEAPFHETHFLFESRVIKLIYSHLPLFREGFGRSHFLFVFCHKCVYLNSVHVIEGFDFHLLPAYVRVLSREGGERVWKESCQRYYSTIGEDTAILPPYLCRKVDLLPKIHIM